MSKLREKMLEGAAEMVRARCGENKQITGDDYDKSLAVKYESGNEIFAQTAPIT